MSIKIFVVYFLAFILVNPTAKEFDLTEGEQHMHVRMESPRNWDVRIRFQDKEHRVRVRFEKTNIIIGDSENKIQYDMADVIPEADEIMRQRRAKDLVCVDQEQIMCMQDLVQSDHSAEFILREYDNRSDSDQPEPIRIEWQEPATAVENVNEQIDPEQ
ncbi:MAG: hypothetical protein KDK27_18055 [Leptospiraceae bacterium]|nr:hypothetical protein [Leptospiraceae bacterium]